MEIRGKFMSIVCFGHELERNSFGVEVLLGI